MISSTHSRLANLVFIALTIPFLSACDAVDPIVRPPKGGGQRNEAWNCAVGTGGNSAWTNARLTGDITLPVKCPYHVLSTGNIDLAAELFGPKATTSLNGGATLGTIFSAIDPTMMVAATQSQYWGEDANNPDGRRLVFNVRYLAAYYPAWSAGPYSHDSGTVYVDQTNYGQARAFVTLSGSNDMNPGYITYPSAVAGLPTQFRAVTDVDTNAYDFSWSIDGTNVGNNDALLTTTLSTAGPHQVTAYATYENGTSTITKTVNVALNVTFNGNTSAKRGGRITYSAVVGGGTAPYSYRWYVNGAQVSTASSYQYTFGTTCTTHLQLNVSDGAGHSGSVSEDLLLIDPSC